MTMQVALLADGRRLHLQHGPIDLVIEAWGARTEVERAYRQAIAAFEDVLPGLVRELPSLRQALPMDPTAMAPVMDGAIARRMIAACWPYRQGFVTPMAAVAGSVADHILAALLADRQIVKAYVNNGGDIAVHLSAGQTFDCGLVTDLLAPHLAGSIHLTSAMQVGGVATSGAPGKGRGGRSFSLGIADEVTVLAKDAAAADAAATVIANAVDLPDHPGISRVAAVSIDPDSDLGECLVTVDVPVLAATEVAMALEHGHSAAAELCRLGQISAAVLALQGEIRLCGTLAERLRAA
jgi:hypothetical protein